ncbi:MAG: oligosaccharide flippase family protein [Planctomycetes bacterium]|nr:oligosaccharide flippase family protein [Planctomycetota bacterium]
MTSAPPPSPGQAEAPTRSLSARATRGAVWSMTSFGGGQLLRLAGNLVLSRLLFEEAFGLMALVNAFLVGLALFSDIGVGPSIVQNERGDDRRFLDTAWTMQVVRGFVLWAVSCAGAAPFAAFYGDPRLAWVLPVAGTTALIAGLNSTKLFTANRHLHLRSLFFVEIGGQAFSLATMVSWAWVDRSVWALVAGGIAHALMRMILSHALLPGAGNRLAWEARSVRALFQFGRWIFLSTVLTFLVQQADRLIFGQMIPIALLGVYSIAAMLAALPTTAVGSIAIQVAFPFISRIRQRGDDVAAAFVRVRRPLLVCGGWMLSGLMAGGPLVVRILYDERWHAAGWILQLLAVAGWFFVLVSTNEMFLLAMGQSRMLAVAGASKLAGMLLLIPVGFALGGFEGAVGGYVGSALLHYLVSLATARAHGLLGFAQDARLSAACALAAGLGAGIAVAGREWHDALTAGVVFLAVTAVWLPLAVPLVAELRARAAAAAA